LRALAVFFMGFLSSELLLLEQPSFFAVWFVRAVECASPCE
jgi:hypothetical protein